MLASWYEQQGRAADVLRIGELPDPEPGPGEVRVRIHVSGVNPSDAKKRNGWLGNAMAYPCIIPHSDGAGVIDRVGTGVSDRRIGQRVWVYGAQSRRPFGTAAQFTCVPDQQAVELPSGVHDEVGACLGSPGITAHHAVFADGPVEEKCVLVHGVLGSVGSLAAQLASWGGAAVIATVCQSADKEQVPVAKAGYLGVVALDSADPVGEIRRLAPGGVDRIIETSLSRNVDLDAAVAASGAVIVASASRSYRPDIPFWPLAFANVTLRLIYSGGISDEAKQQAAHDLMTASESFGLDVPIAECYPLANIARGHELVDAGVLGRVLVTIPPVDCVRSRP